MNLQPVPAARLRRLKLRLKAPALSRRSALVVSAGQNGSVKTLEQLAAKYGLAPADELAGPDSSRAYIDYGRPVVLADSSRSPHRTKREEALWSRALKR